MTFRYFFIFFLLFSGLTKCFAQPEIIEGLKQKGFENIIVKTTDNEYIISVKNGMYRMDLFAIKEILKQLSGIEHIKPKTTILLTKGQIPYSYYTFSSSAINFINGDTSQFCNLSSEIIAGIPNDSLINSIRNEIVTAPGKYKVDISVEPQASAILGNYDDPIKPQFNLAPIISTSLWKGFNISGQIIFPLYNEIAYDHTDKIYENPNTVRPAYINASQLFILSKKTYLSATVGYFTEHRYGLVLEAKKTLNNDLVSFGGNIGYTGFWNFYKRQILFWDFDKITGQVFVEGFVPKYDLTLKLNAGSFVFRDKGVRIDIYREFKEIRIGFYVVYTEMGKNGGFNIRIPIPPKKYYRYKYARIRPDNYFEYVYSAKSTYAATTFHSNTYYRETMQNMHPLVIKRLLVNEIINKKLIINK
jgi:hypothetical protein